MSKKYENNDLVKQVCSENEAYQLVWDALYYPASWEVDESELDPLELPCMVAVLEHVNKKGIDHVWEDGEDLYGFSDETEMAQFFDEHREVLAKTFATEPYSADFLDVIYTVGIADVVNMTVKAKAELVRRFFHTTVWAILLEYNHRC